MSPTMLHPVPGLLLVTAATVCTLPDLLQCSTIAITVVHPTMTVMTMNGSGGDISYSIPPSGGPTVTPVMMPVRHKQ